MINSSALGIYNNEKLIAQLQLYGFANTQKLEFFNCYPLNKGQSLLLKTMSRFTHKKMSTKNMISCNYYFTDCLEFKSIANIQAKEEFAEDQATLQSVVGHFSLSEIPIAFFKQYGPQAKKSIH